MDELELISDLYEKQLSICDDPYLTLRFQNKAHIRRKIDAFQKYKNFVSGKVLDWGCKHAVDACLAKNLYKDLISIYGCDVGEDVYSVFFDFAGLKYEPLTSPNILPYEDEQFDTVIGSGVLEHVPNDRSSLCEIYRVLKPLGHLCITFLPNEYSINEFLIRQYKRINNYEKYTHHRRYSLQEIKKELLHHGFLPVSYGYHQILPSSGGKFSEKIYQYNHVLEQIWPILLLSTNIFIIAKKRLVM
jgi:ubiquinone/menaquinone biosynthesis C-methylase UbiE